MTKIIYERERSDNPSAKIILEGNGPDLLQALVQICFSFQDRLGVNIEKLASALPLMVKLEAMTMPGTTTIDLSALKKEGGGK